MQRGHRKADTPEMKAVRGTVRPSRDGVDTIESLSPVLSISPPKLPLDVADVWAEYVGAAISHGARQCDADSFAEWCTMSAFLRRARNGSEEDGGEGGVPAPASYVQQWRQLGELFGLAGPKSRVMPKGQADSGKGSNPFARNGRRG